jgi:hypothetical protein
VPDPEDAEPGRGAVADPAGYYTDPTAIQADKTLSKPQKQRYLAALGADLAQAPRPDPDLQDDVKVVRARVDGAPPAKAGEARSQDRVTAPARG